MRSLKKESYFTGFYFETPIFALIDYKGQIVDQLLAENFNALAVGKNHPFEVQLIKENKTEISKLRFSPESIELETIDKNEYLSHSHKCISLILEAVRNDFGIPGTIKNAVTYQVSIDETQKKLIASSLSKSSKSILGIDVTNTLAEETFEYVSEGKNYSITTYVAQETPTDQYLVLNVEILSPQVFTESAENFKTNEKDSIEYTFHLLGTLLKHFQIT